MDIRSSERQDGLVLNQIWYSHWVDPEQAAGAWTSTQFIPRRTTLTARRKLPTVASSLVHHVATSELRLLNGQVRTL